MRRWVEPRELSRLLVSRCALWLLLATLALLPGAQAEEVQTIPLSTFAAQIAAARQLAAACADSAAACDPVRVPARQQVQGAPAGLFFTDWDWLRDALTAAQTASAVDRSRTMHQALDRLDMLAAEASAAPRPAAATDFSRAHAAAAAALARDEFRAVAEGPTWLERQAARVQDWILRLFTGMDRLGKRAPWIAPLVEWSFFGLAAAGLLWFVRQSLARQALRISLAEGAPLARHGDRDRADWARLAQERAAAHDWREAIHNLYWAAILLLEDRRAWKPNPTRTPREYLHLLRPESEAQQVLRGLTRTFEQVWYGFANADAHLYQGALRALEELTAIRPERAELASGSSGRQPAPPGPTPAAGGA